jgi:hypothetical protein
MTKAKFIFCMFFVFLVACNSNKGSDNSDSKKLPAVSPLDMPNKFIQTCDLKGATGDDQIGSCLGINDVKLLFNSLDRCLAIPTQNEHELADADLYICQEIGTIHGRISEIDVRSMGVRQLTVQNSDQLYPLLDKVISATIDLTLYCDVGVSSVKYRNRTTLPDDLTKLDILLNQLVLNLELKLKNN